MHELEGVKPVVALARNYSSDGSASHLVGYVSDVDVKDLEQNEYLREMNISGLQIGKSGLEKSFNSQMIGSPGLQRYEVNAYGKRIKELEFIEGSPGKNFRTTIDKEVQQT